MDYSAANTQLWNGIMQIAIIATTLLIANILRRKITFIRRAVIPTAVLGGFLLLAGKMTGLVRLDLSFMEQITYHGIALGFIAQSLRVPDDQAPRENHVGLKSGAVIVSSYMIQVVTGLVISILLAYTIMPGFFKASGLLLAMGYGQGPGQANNIGVSYETMGFAGGRAFGLAISAAGYLSACIVGVLYMTRMVRSGKFVRKDHQELSEAATIGDFQHDNEIPVAESLDKFSVQFALVLLVYGITFLLTKGVTGALSSFAPGLANTLNPLLWGFNFMIGSGIAIGTRSVMKQLRKVKLMNRQYQNNYLLSRISGVAYDFMIVAGIASIEIGDLSGLWLPFILMSVAGAITTLIHLRYVCKLVYKDYYYEGMLSMYGMMTGTISSGVLLLRELDPELKTSASNNLVVGSSFAILLAAPLLVLVGLAPKSTGMTFLTLFIGCAYYVLLVLMVKYKKK
jgi:ESS family glutamate:Na+ symporter